MTPSPASGFFEVQGRARFQLSGPDATRYLNGQVSIDITRLQPLIARPACLLTAKGKLCALVQVWRDGDNLVIECDESLAETVQARLERYLIADDAHLEPLPMPPLLNHIFGIEAPAGDLRINRTGLSGFDNAEKPSGLTAATPEQLALLRIVHGQPTWGVEITEDTLPQEARLEDAAVDFDKGCYVGQETVSRLKSVGRVNKRLHGFLGSLPANLTLPARLHPIGQPDTTAGHLTSTASLHFDIAQTAALGYLNPQFENLERLGVSDDQGLPLGEVERRAFPIL